jgi:hypothetical protein
MKEIGAVVRVLPHEFRGAAPISFTSQQLNRAKRSSSGQPVLANEWQIATAHPHSDRPVN